jgi:hypothetical protein
MIRAKLLLIGIAALSVLSASAAHADTTRPSLLPPTEFDRPFDGTTVVERVDNLIDLKRACYMLEGSVGCAHSSEGHCRITMMPDHYYRLHLMDPMDVFRHEMGHCNGWPGNHIGTNLYELLGKQRWLSRNGSGAYQEMFRDGEYQETWRNQRSPFYNDVW